MLAAEGHVQKLPFEAWDLPGTERANAFKAAKALA